VEFITDFVIFAIEDPKKIGRTTFVDGKS
jgi:hypothetical protein